MRVPATTLSSRASPVSGCFVAQGGRDRREGARHNKKRSRGALGLWSLILFTLVIGAALFAAPAYAADKPVTWKPITQALLRVNDQPVKNWNVYEQNKKGDPLLLAMGDRYLLIQVHERKIFELAPTKIEHKGTELLWDPATLPAEPLATTEWLIKDVGFAYRVGVRLVAENRLVDLQLPHPMDLRYL
jgi:ABC-type microcin C transport system permease subunit YejE